MFFRAWRFFAISLAAPALLASDKFPDARDLLLRSDAELFAGGTARLQLQLNTDASILGFEMKAPASATMEIASGGRFRYQGRIGTTDVLVVSNGSTTWIYSPSKNSYSVSTAKQNLPWSDLENITYGRSPDAILSASVERKESIEV